MKYNLGDLVFVQHRGRIKQGKIVGRITYERFKGTGHETTSLEYDIHFGPCEEVFQEESVYGSLEELTNDLTDYYEV
jgi:hypothetical protein